MSITYEAGRMLLVEDLEPFVEPEDRELGQIPAYARQPLYRHGIYTRAQLARIPDDVLLAARCFGAGSLRVVRAHVPFDGEANGQA